MTLESLDKSANQPIVDETTTPPAGASNTDRGLTGHAELSSTAADCNTNLASSSRQSLPSAAVDDFSVEKRAEYCPPPDKLVNEYIWTAANFLATDEASSKQLIATRQGFGQFLRVVIRIMTKDANRREAECHQDPQDL